MSSQVTTDFLFYAPCYQYPHFTCFLSHSLLCTVSSLCLLCIFGGLSLFSCFLPCHTGSLAITCLVSLCLFNCCYTSILHYIFHLVVIQYNTRFCLPLYTYLNYITATFGFMFYSTLPCWKQGGTFLLSISLRVS